MSFERGEEPTAAFTPNWDPLWDDESPWPPVPAMALERPVFEPPAPAQAQAPASPRVEAVSSVERPAPADVVDDPTPARPVTRTAETHRPPVGRTRRVLSRFRSAVVLAIVVVLSGIAMALAFGVVVGVIGLVLKKTVGG